LRRLPQLASHSATPCSNPAVNDQSSTPSPYSSGVASLVGNETDGEENDVDSVFLRGPNIEAGPIHRLSYREKVRVFVLEIDAVIFMLAGCCWRL